MEDPEDEMECECYMIFCIAKDGRVFTDRVYRDKSLCEKRLQYLNKISGERGQWYAALSELGR